MAIYSPSGNLVDFLEANPGAAVQGDSILASGPLIVDRSLPRPICRIQTAADFTVDGTGLPEGELLIFQMLPNSTDLSVTDYRATLSVKGKWVNVGTTDGTDGQTISLSGYWGSNIVDVVPAVWVETGRRIQYTSGNGIAPNVEDWLYLDGSKNPAGQIVAVGPDYIDVKFLIGTTTSGTALSIRKIIDNDGPDNVVTWTASATGADVKADDIYQGFANVVHLGTSYLSACGNGVDGFAFENFQGSLSLTFGSSATGGFVPPAGCNIRIPNVHFCSNDQANFDAGTNRYTTNPNQNQARANSNGGAELSICNFGNFRPALRDGDGRNIQAEYLGCHVQLGFSVRQEASYYKQCVVTKCAPAKFENHFGEFLRISGCRDGMSVEDCYLIDPARLSGSVFFSDAQNVSIKNSIIVHKESQGLTQGTRSSINMLRSSNININNCLIHGQINWIGSTQALVFIDACQKVVLEKNFYHASDRPITAQAAKFFGSYDSNDVRIVGVELLSQHHTERVLDIISGEKIRIYCMGEIDDPLTYSSARTSASYMVFPGNAEDIVAARLYADRTDPGGASVFYYTSYKGKTKVLNCGFKNQGSYQDRVVLRSYSERTVAGQWGYDDNFEQYWAMAGAGSGSQSHDVFYNETRGFVFAVASQNNEHENAITVISGDPEIYSGSAKMRFGDEIVIEQNYFAKGHTGLTGIARCSDRQYSHSVSRFSNNVSYYIQYDNGSGWNGQWIDGKDPVALAGIPVNPSGFKIKHRIVHDNSNHTGTEAVAIAGVETTTTIQDQKQNLHPLDLNFVPVNVSVREVDQTPVENAKVILFASQGGPLPAGQVIFNRTTNASGNASVAEFLLTGSQPFTGWVRKSSASPLYKQSPISGTISATNGLDATVIMIPDE